MTNLKKEIEFQKGQFLGMFAGLGEELKTTLALVAVIAPPIALMLIAIDLAFRLFQ
jgi:hypothetical protein